MTFDELCQVEAAFLRSSHAIRRVATHELISDLLKAEVVIQEVRHAGSTLCDPDAPPSLREAAMKRLLVTLFGEHHVQL